MICQKCKKKAWVKGLCRKHYHNERYRNDPESARRRSREYRQRHPKRSCQVWRAWAHSERGRVTLLLNYAKDRAKIDNLPFRLDRKWLEEKIRAGICEVTGIKFEILPPGRYRAHPLTPSIDRIVPSKGYTKKNCRLVCYCVNVLRGGLGDETLIKIASAIVEKQKKEMFVLKDGTK